MKPKTPGNYPMEALNENLSQSDILRQITEWLEGLHSKKNFHTGLTPSCVILDEKQKLLSVNPNNSDESLSEWRPAEETYLAHNSNSELKLTKEGDIFNLGCFFYYIITRGQHPFGRPGQRVSFIANNLYDLSACRDKQLQKLITKMISHDSKQRPTCLELLNHPYLWKNEKIEKYLYKKAVQLDEASKEYDKLNDHFLLSSSKPSFVKSVAEILDDIKREKEAPLNACTIFPDLLSSVFFTYNPESKFNKEIDDDEFSPITFQNLLIANACFRERLFNGVGPFEKCNGRFGLQPVYIMKFSQPSTDIREESLILMKRLACLSHPNVLEYFYVGENATDNSSERLIVLACEQFNETLETLTKKNSLDFETAKDIFIQTTAGLLDYHSNNLIHGNITFSQIAIFNNSENIVAKISKFPFSDDKDEQRSMQNDIRKLGQTFSDLFNQVSNMPLLCNHLLESMKSTKDERVPSCEALFYHPFFWSSGEIADFLLAAGDFYTDNSNIDANSKMEQNINLKTEYRPAIEFLQSTVRAAPYAVRDSVMEEIAKELAVELAKEIPMLVIETWLELQNYKSTDSDMDLDPFYYPTYDFPTYNELWPDGKHTLEGDKTKCHPEIEQADTQVEKVSPEIDARNALSTTDDEDEGYYSESETILDSHVAPETEPIRITELLIPKKAKIDDSAKILTLFLRNYQQFSSDNKNFDRT